MLPVEHMILFLVFSQPIRAHRKIRLQALTGSAQCTLGPDWGTKWGRTVMTGYQASDRGGAVRVELQGDRVNLGGRAVTVAKIELTQTDH